MMNDNATSSEFNRRSNLHNWPPDILSFAFFPPDLDAALAQLSQTAEDEKWDYQDPPTDRQNPVLHYYITGTYRRVAYQDKIVLSENGENCCFNTGLVTDRQEAIYASFEANSRQDDRARPWYFKGWLRGGEVRMSRYPELPEQADYVGDPSRWFFHTDREFRTNVEHIIGDRKDRFPEEIRQVDDYQAMLVLEGAIKRAIDRVKKNPKTAVPQFFKNDVHLLLPLYLVNPVRADLALAVECHPTFYRAATCLTLDMAYANARVLAKPDTDWLHS